jgi:hypothetical protein
MIITQKMLDEANLLGWVEIDEDIYLHTRESLQIDQKTWEDEDEAKLQDYTQSDYWLEIVGQGLPVAIGLHDAI